MANTVLLDPLQKALALALFPWATSMRVIGVVVWETLDLVATVTGRDEPGI